VIKVLGDVFVMRGAWDKVVGRQIPVCHGPQNMGISWFESLDKLPIFNNKRWEIQKTGRSRTQTISYLASYRPEDVGPLNTLSSSFIGVRAIDGLCVACMVLRRLVDKCWWSFIEKNKPAAVWYLQLGYW
jgi:hypothetical protein